MDESLEEYIKKSEQAYLTLNPPPNHNKITSQELAKINKKAYCEALADFLKTAYKRQFIKEFAMDGKMPYIPSDPEQKRLLECQMDDLATKPPYMLITINPRKGVTLDELKKAVQKFVKKKTIPEYFYVYEVRKENEGLHCHILLRYTPKPYAFRRGAKNTFKNVCDSNNPHILNMKYVTPDKLADKVNYLLGDKKQSKQNGVKATKMYRKENGLSEFYESIPPLPCRDTQKTIGLEVMNPPPPLRSGGEEFPKTETLNLIPPEGKQDN